MQIQLYNFSDTVFIQQQKNGKFKFDFRSKEGNIYKTLHFLGYCKAKIGDKYAYYYRAGDQLTITNLSDIKNAFSDYLKKCNEQTLLNGVNKEDIINAFYKESPIKENDLLKDYLEDIPTDQEIHNLRIQFDHKYRQEYEKEELLKKFQEWQLAKSVDEVGVFKKGKDIYFKKISKNSFLVFNNYISNKKNQSYISDCWLASYKNSKEFNIRKPSKIETIMLGFKLETDFELVKKYLVVH